MTDGRRTIGRRRVLGALSALPILAAGARDAAAQGGFLDAAKGLLQGAGRSGGAGLSDGDISLGLRDALKVGSERVVDLLGRADGFYGDPGIRIPLPGYLAKAAEVMRTLGMSSMLDDLELRINRAAEAATPKAKAIFWDSIQKMTLDDVRGIFNGPQDAATRYFERTMTDPLMRAFRPPVDRSLADVGAVRAYDQLIAQYKAVPFVPDVKGSLSNHTIEGALGGIFHYLAKEEAAIRSNPASRTTDILKKVFGQG